MDSMSYRNNRQPQRKRPDEESSTALTPQEAPVAAPVQRQAHAARAGYEKRRKKPFVLMGIVAIVLLAGAVVWFLFGRADSTSSAIQSDKYQAVFFDNDQIYFGKLSELNSESMKLTEVYYLKNKESSDTKNANPQQNADDLELVKLGGEIHGPEDEMIIAKNQILFFENLKPDGKVSQSISNYKSQNN